MFISRRGGGGGGGVRGELYKFTSRKKPLARFLIFLAWKHLQKFRPSVYFRIIILRLVSGETLD